ncbi:MAG: SAM-dependent methyltransferase, partial [Sphingobium sp.]|nr:SAM-dependent methyltransferase [Sphingobium sp.]
MVRKSQPHPDTVPGLPARRAALRLLDAVLRRGDPLELALHGAAQGLPPSDRALVHAIAAETLRHLPDLDALIDGATQQVLPPDAKARMVLRIALVQTLALDTPPHAAIATALPLIDGGPRKLVHGVFGTVTRATPTLPVPPTLPAEVAARWDAQWGAAMVEAAARAYAIRPPVDISLRDAAETARWTEELGGTSLAPGHVRLP